MPTQTFFNLPEAKRQALLDAAIEEFADNSYNHASISRIVARLGIAKGSIYQYFQDKQDLYLYLLDLVIQEKLALLHGVQSPDPQMNIFAFLRWLLRSSADFNFTRPRLAQVAYRAIYDDLPFHDETIARMRAASATYISQLVQQGIAQGDIAPEVDPELAVFVINTLSADFGNFIFARLGVDPRTLDGENPLRQHLPEIEQLFDQLVTILEQGLGNRQAGTAPGRESQGATDDTR